MSSSSLETAYFNKDITAFANIATILGKTGQIDKEYLNTDPVADQIFRRGTALTNIVALTPFDIDSLIYVQILLENHANPNHANQTLNGLKPLGNLIQNAQQNFVYADSDSLDTSLEALIKLLLSYGVNTLPYEKSNGEVPEMIEKILLDYSSEIDLTDHKLLYEELCSELSKENNLTKLRLLAKALEVSTKGNKAELCNVISQHLIHLSH